MDASKILGTAAKVMRGAALISVVATAMIGFFVVLAAKLAAAAVILAGGAASFGACSVLARALQQQADELRAEPDSRPAAARERRMMRVRWDAVRRLREAERRVS